MTRKNISLLVESLGNPSVYDHPVEKIELVETHISWIVLTGPYAYKIKKPVDLGFVDFSTLEKRHFYCQEELRLNRRLAPSLYLELVAIAGSEEKPELNGKGPVVEYAVKMIQFDRNQELDRVLERGELMKPHLDLLARELAEFHRQADTSGEKSPFGTPERLALPMRDNFSQIRELVKDSKEAEQINRLREWTEADLKKHQEDFQDRKKSGFIRECHGDLHLANMVLINGRVMVFDALEFNENLRFIDIMSDLAFLLMDLDDRGHSELANRFLNHYLRAGGDYAGLKVLRTYKVYRAMVRAKVASIRLSQPDLEQEEKSRLWEAHRSYVGLAEHYTRPAKNCLLMTSGFSGAGKSFLAEQISEINGAVWIRTDVERRRMTELSASGEAESPVEKGIYTAEMTLRTYDRIGQLARDLLKEGYSVILDGAFLRRQQRSSMTDMARKIGIPYLILNCSVPEAELRKRVIQRKKEGIDPSEAGLNVLQWQKKTFEPFSSGELSHVFTVDTTIPVHIRHLMDEIHRRIDYSGEKQTSMGL